MKIKQRHDIMITMSKLNILNIIKKYIKHKLKS